MNIEVVLTADKAFEVIKKTKAAAVIDVFRATSVITTAIANGAKAVIPFKSIEETLDFKRRVSGNVLLCGERGRVIIEGFDCGNSPYEYTRELVANKTLAFTTTNGTMAIENSKAASKLYIMSFLNTKAVCNKLMASGNDIVLVCAGTGGKFSIDDFLCAGKAVAYITQQCTYELDDAAIAARQYYEQDGGNIRELIKESASYKGVIRAGFEKDIDFCLNEDSIQITPVYKDGAVECE